jgi:HK97 family phage prohead protease
MLELRSRLGVRTAAELAGRWIEERPRERRASAPIPAAEQPRYISGTRITGRAVTFNDPIFSYRRSSKSYQDAPMVFRPGCFDESLEHGDIKLVLTHEWETKAEVLARTGDHTLMVAEEGQGLYFTSSQLKDNDFSRLAIEEIKAQRVIGASLETEMIEYQITRFHDLRVQLVTRAKLNAISLVENPGCGATWLRIT